MNRMTLKRIMRPNVSEEVQTKNAGKNLWKIWKRPWL